LFAQKKRSKEKGAFFKEFFGEKCQKPWLKPRVEPIEKIGSPESRGFSHIFCEKGFKKKGKVV